MSFIEELKRRKVVRAAIVYGAVAFAVLQGAELLTGVFQLPQVVLTGIGVVAVLGFPITLVLAGAFDVTPEGLARTADADDAALRPGSPRWISPATAGVAVGLVAVGLAVGWFARSTTGPAGGRDAAVERSIAVLPFVDMSPEGDQQYLSDGISEEILNQLVKIGDLSVTGRTSSFAYRGEELDLREIGTELGVATVLEGSVRKDGDELRITAQLINVDEGFHLWSETYDRRLEGIFQLQEEIAREIAGALSATLTPAEEGRLGGAPVTNPVAYDLLQRARSQNETNLGEMQVAMGLLQEALAVDSMFGDAYAELARQ